MQTYNSPIHVFIFADVSGLSDLSLLEEPPLQSCLMKHKRGLESPKKRVSFTTDKENNLPFPITETKLRSASPTKPPRPSLSEAAVAKERLPTAELHAKVDRARYMLHLQSRLLKVKQGLDTQPSGPDRLRIPWKQATTWHPLNRTVWLLYYSQVIICWECFLKPYSYIPTLKNIVRTSGKVSSNWYTREDPIVNWSYMALNKNDNRTGSVKLLSEMWCIFPLVATALKFCQNRHTKYFTESNWTSVVKLGQCKAQLFSTLIGMAGLSVSWFSDYWKATVLAVEGNID